MDSSKIGTYLLDYLRDGDRESAEMKLPDGAAGFLQLVTAIDNDIVSANTMQERSRGTSQ